MATTGLIYKVTNTVTGKEYYGKTKRAIEVRWKEHKASARKLAANREAGVTTAKIEKSHLYNSMIYYGADQFRIEVIEQGIPLAELSGRESYHIVANNAISVGYNCNTGGGRGSQVSDATKKKMSETHQRIAEENRAPRMKGLPPRIHLTTTTAYGEALRLANHPLCRERWFFFRTYGGFEGAKAAAITFVAELEAKGVKYTRKQDPEIPRGIYRKDGGYTWTR